jgi:hypothetical protein
MNIVNFKFFRMFISIEYKKVSMKIFFIIQKAFDKNEFLKLLFL